jgi:hypothetical protein
LTPFPNNAAQARTTNETLASSQLNTQQPTKQLPIMSFLLRAADAGHLERIEALLMEVTKATNSQLCVSAAKVKGLQTQSA